MGVKEPFGETISYTICIFSMFVLGILIPIGLLLVGCSNEKLLEKHEWIRKLFGKFHENIRLE